MAGGKPRGLKGAISACASKRSFSSLSAAKVAAGDLQKPYVCPVCNAYHLTSSPRGANVSEPVPEVKPTFEPSILGRARLVRPKSIPPPARVVSAVCVGQPKPDGRVRVKVGKEEMETEPVQPAHLRLELRKGVKVKVEISSSGERCVRVVAI